MPDQSAEDKKKAEEAKKAEDAKKAKEAEDKKKAEEAKKAEAGLKYYRCQQYSALSVRSGEGEDDFERFTAYFEKYQGDTVKVGYLATKNKHTIGILDADSNVEKIEKSEYERATQGKNSVKAVQPLA